MSERLHVREEDSLASGQRSRRWRLRVSFKSCGQGLVGEGCVSDELALVTSVGEPVASTFEGMAHRLTNAWSIQYTMKCFFFTLSTP